MLQITRFFPFVLLATMLSCAAPLTPGLYRISGTFTGQAAHPMVGVLVGEGPTADAAIAEITTKLAAIPAQGAISFDLTATPDKTGLYGLLLQTNQRAAAFYIYAWDDTNQNGRADQGSEGPAQTMASQSYYVVLRDPVAGFETLEPDGRAVPGSTGQTALNLDFTF